MHVQVHPVDVDKLADYKKYSSESSADIQKKVQKARDIQLKRFESKQIFSNGEMSTKETKNFCLLGDDCKKVLRAAVSRMNLSARSYFKVIKVSRTIADLDGSDIISVNHIAEALQYRPKEESF